jgi:hypothetical protein
MTTAIGAYVAEQRKVKHLTRGQLAAAMGYSNLAKGANRISALERSGRSVEGLLEKVITVLELDRQRVRTLLEEDRRRVADDWQRWADEAVEPELRFRAIPAVWCVDSTMPRHLSRGQAIQVARSRAMDRKRTYVLVWSRTEEIWCYPGGGTYLKTMEVGEAAGPFTRLRRRADRGFVFGPPSTVAPRPGR